MLPDVGMPCILVFEDVVLSASMTSQETSGAMHRRTSLADIQLGWGLGKTIFSELSQADQASRRYCIQAMRERHAYLAAINIERYATFVLRERKESYRAAESIGSPSERHQSEA